MTAILDRLETPENLDEFPRDLSPEFSDELTDGYEADEPSSAFDAVPASRTLSQKMKPSGDLITPSEKRRIAAEIEVYLELVNGAWEMGCPHCAEVVEKSIKPVSQRVANILARYPDLARKLIASGIIADWVGLLVALRPIAKQISAHHITHTISYDDEDQGDDLESFQPYQQQPAGGGRRRG